MLALLIMLLAAATPPAPTPMATNPFTLSPLPRPSNLPLPVIGTTRARPVCTALRQAVKPALEAAMKNDAIFKSGRTTIYDYIVKDNDDARNLRIVQMDKQIGELVKLTDALDDAVNSTTFRPGPATHPDDAKSLHEMQTSLKGVAVAQHVQLEAMSGFVETERMRLFGKLDESQQQLQNATAYTGHTGSTPSPVTGFLADSKQSLVSQHPTPQGLHGAMLVDRDLSDIQTYTARRESVASQAIMAAASRCR